jgi:hypothetical protein
VRWAAIATIIVVLPMQFGRGAVLPISDPTDEVTAVVEEYVAERGSATEVVDVEVEVDDGLTKIDVVLASSIEAVAVNALAEDLAGYLSAPVELRLLLVSAETNRATVVP